MRDVCDGVGDGGEWNLAADGPYRGGRVHVLADLCTTCVFHPGNRMNLRSGRLRDMVAEATGNGSAITCHTTLPLPGRRAICAGYWRRFASQVMVLRLAQALDVVTYDPPPEEDH